MVNGPAACCTEMFQTWLKGAGRQPASWKIVIKVLEDGERTWHNRSKKHCKVHGQGEEYSQTITMFRFMLLNV